MTSNSAVLDTNQASICALKQASICALKKASICALINGDEQENRPTVTLNLENLFETVR
jgi:hypothetical protein